MKQAFWLGLSMLLAAGMAFAQDTSMQSPTTSSQSSTTQSTVIRGCLSGSAGNFTLTDQNGMQYKVLGDDSALGAKVGREVEITGTENQSTEAASQGGDSMAHASNSVQASNVREVASHCKMGAAAGEPTSDSNGMNPKGTPETSEPSQPQPQEMAMLLPQDTPQSSSGQPQTSPPVTSQTPATSTSPTNPDSQVGSSPANNTGMSESEANHDAQAARQGELNTNPKNGETTGRGVNNQGVNNPTQTSPNAVPDSRNSTSGSQGNNNDQSKPLYERQATDVPWANHSGSNNGSTTTTPQQ
jgi:hypothetical protein